jgi:hypothetical protein
MIIRRIMSLLYCSIAAYTVAATLVKTLLRSKIQPMKKKGDNITASVTHAAMPHYPFFRKRKTFSFYIFEHAY